MHRPLMLGLVLTDLGAAAVLFPPAAPVSQAVYLVIMHNGQAPAGIIGRMTGGAPEQTSTSEMRSRR